MSGLVPYGRVKLLSYEDGREYLREWLFVNTMDDISKRLDAPNPSRYDTLMLTPLIRKLTTESPTLIDVLEKANRGRPKVEYMCSPFESSQAPVPNARSLMLADTRFALPSVTMTPRQFLNTAVGEFDGEPISVRAVIKHFSHVEGGVHLGNRDRTPAGDMMQAMHPGMPFGLGDLSLRVVPPIARVILNGCHALLAHVRESVAAVESGNDPRLGADAKARFGMQHPTDS